MRGLKLIRRLLKVVLMLSHLLQMRGLKRLTDAQRTQVERRIFYRCVDWNFCYVTFKGCWFKSHLLQMRGLKQLQGQKQHEQICRIFYRCVDWNHKVRKGTLKKDKSHLLQMRGLKPRGGKPIGGHLRSHLLQMRGLKQCCKIRSHDR